MGHVVAHSTACPAAPSRRRRAAPGAHAPATLHCRCAAAAQPLLVNRPRPLPAACRALVRLVAWRRSGSRLVLHGGCGNLEQAAEAGRGGSALAQGRPQEVFGAFAAFRQSRCRPVVGGGAAAAAAAGGKAGGKAGAGPAPRAGLGRPAALHEQLIVAAELLHVLRPLAYALALRR